MSLNCFTSSRSNGGSPSRRKMNEAPQSQYSESKRNCNARSNEKEEHDLFILIPFSVMFNNGPNFDVKTFKNDELSSWKYGQKKQITYKLIDGAPSATEIRKRKSYIMSYNNETKNARWVYEILNKSILPVEQQTSARGDENSLKVITFGKKLNDSDYDQGHLAAAANHTWCMEAYHDTYLISNMTPQFKVLNTGVWKSLEISCRNILKEKNVRNVHVYTGPLYLSTTESELEYGFETLKYYIPESDPSSMTRLGGKVKPTHFFKVVIVENENGTVKEPIFYRMPNCKDKRFDKKTKKTKETKETKEMDFLGDFQTNVDIFEKESGLKFIISIPNVKTFSKLQDITWNGEDGEGNSCTVTSTVNLNNMSSV